MTALEQKNIYQPTPHMLLRALESMAGVGFCTLSFVDGRVHASDGLHMLAGTLDHIGEAIGLEFIEARTHPDDRATLIQSFHMLMRDTLPTQRCLRLIRADGTERRLEMRFERLLDEASKSVGWVICVFDRTEAESLNKNLALTRHRLRAVLDQINVDLAWFSSLDGRLIESVKQSESLVTPGSTLFSLESWLSSVHPDDRATMADHLEHSDVDVAEVRVEASPGEYVKLRSVRHPVRDDHGQTVEWYGLTTLVQPGHGGLDADAAASEELLNGPLLRAGRNLLGWTIPVLAERSEVSASTIMRIEEASAPIVEVARRRTAERLTSALANGGVVFHRTLTGKLAISL